MVLGTDEARMDGQMTTGGNVVVGIAGSGSDALAQRVKDLGDQVRAEPETWPPRGLELPERVAEQPDRAVLVSSSTAELLDQLEATARYLATGGGKRLLGGKGIFVSEPGDEHEGKLAMLFPGQGAQHVGMLSELASESDVVRRCLDEADEVMLPLLDRRLTDLIAGRGADPEAAERALMQTLVTQPAVLACDVAMLRLLEARGLRPDVVAGHSLGEYAAAVAAGVMSFADALRTVAVRAREMTSATPAGVDPGRMAALRAPLGQVEELMAEVDGYLVAANKNCPIQTIVAGASDAVDAMMALADERGVVAKRLPVSHAFHTTIVAPACEPLARVLREIELRPPAVPLLANVTGDLYPTGAGGVEAVVDLLSRQVASPVEFIAQIERMYEIGVRTFVEVGPGRTLSTFVAKTLGKRPHQAFSSNQPQKGELRSFAECLAALLAAGRTLDV